MLESPLVTSDYRIILGIAAWFIPAIASLLIVCSLVRICIGNILDSSSFGFNPSCLVFTPDDYYARNTPSDE